jgi:hypothetical protein
MTKGTNHTPKQTFYEGTSCLRRGVAQSLSTPFECLGVCGGLSVAFVKRLAAESNDYFHHVLKKNLGHNNMFHGVKWVNITTAEMFHFLGILLRISMEERDGGGYRAYFRTDDKVLHTSTGPNGKSQPIPGTKGWAWRYMSLRHFMQIRAAFHPESKEAGMSGDKCYQLRSALNHLNKASLRTFVSGGNLAFDEGGVASRSRLCPVRQSTVQQR